LVGLIREKMWTERVGKVKRVVFIEQTTRKEKAVREDVEEEVGALLDIICFGACGELVGGK
jgi:hypothetical protein